MYTERFFKKDKFTQIKSLSELIKYNIFYQSALSVHVFNYKLNLLENQFIHIIIAEKNNNMYKFFSINKKEKYSYEIFIFMTNKEFTYLFTDVNDFWKFDKCILNLYLRKGHIQDIEDAWNALKLLEELKKVDD